jgi:hypothetical protein
MSAADEFPTIDDRVRHVGTSRLRQMTAKDLRKLDKVLAVHGGSAEVLAVLMPYSMYMEIQKKLAAAIGELEQRRDCGPG